MKPWYTNNFPTPATPSSPLTASATDRGRGNRQGEFAPGPGIRDPPRCAKGDSLNTANLAGNKAMEFQLKRSKRRFVVGSGEYPTRLQLYKTPPVDTISLQEFEELALRRLKRECSV